MIIYNLLTLITAAIVGYFWGPAIADGSRALQAANLIAALCFGLTWLALVIFLKVPRSEMARPALLIGCAVAFFTASLWSYPGWARAVLVLILFVWGVVVLSKGKSPA